MEHATQVALIERLFSHVENNTCDMVEREMTNNVRGYIDPAAYEEERKVLFRHYPLLIAHTDELREPGDFLTHDRTGVPILLTRGRNGEVNAFINVCRHRGAVLVKEKRGSRRNAFVCPYHSWTYDAQGSLRGVPDKSGFPNVRLEDSPLVRLPVVERYGFIWVRPSPGPDFDIDAFLGPLAKDFAHFDIAPLKRFAPSEVRRRMNWKLMVDTFLEFYHFRYAHANSVYPLFFHNNSTYELFPPHLRITAPKRTLVTLKDQPKADWRLREHSIILYHIFPNTCVVFMADHMSIFAMYPTGPEESLLDLSFYIEREPKTEKEVSYWTRNAAMIQAATTEDFDIGEGVQAGFHSGAQEHMVYGRFEQGLHGFHKALAQALGRPGPAPL